MSLPHILLGMLRKQSKSGYDLNKELKFVVHYFWETDLSRIYRTLNDLRNKGWVEFQTIVQDGSPNKKVYSITEEGRQELRRWLAAPGKSSHETTRNPFLAQLHFSDAIPPDVQQGVLVERLKTLQEEVSELERRARSLNMPVPLPENALQAGLIREMFSLEYGIRRYYFEIEWTENIIRILQQGLEAEPGRPN